MTQTTLAIIGASLAGAKAAEAARASGYDGRVVLVGDEPVAPYERPPLSKAVLRGEADPDTARVHPEGFYAAHDIEVVTDHVAGVDVGAGRRRIRLTAGDAIEFDTAVLATGSRPRTLHVPGSDLAGVHHLRTVADAIALRDAISAGSRVAVIGAGWIGTEVAASARQSGRDVVMIDPAPVPLQRVLGTEIGSVFRRLHHDHGVELRLGAGVTELRGGNRVEAVVLDDGRVEAADVVVVGIGAVPRTELASGLTGLLVDDGIVVDEHLETNVAGIYAAGDVARAWHPHYRRHIRVEHWSAALNQGGTAGRNATGGRESYDRLPYFFSDQYDLGLEDVGLSSTDDQVVVRGDVETWEFIAFWHRDGIVTAAMNVNVWDVIEDLKALLLRGAPIDPAALADPDVPLAGLSGAQPAPARRGTACGSP
jgi:3-phenylpropionate/trans-cinnamate dioxygenase ferredoxin reductase subunit